MERRRFLKWMMAAGASCFVKPRLDAWAQALDRGAGPGAAHEPLLVKTIPSTGEKVPAVGLGSYRVFDVGDSANERAPLKEVLSLFQQSGGRLVDSSPMYGRSEKVIGDLARGLGITDKLFMATKVWTEGRDDGVAEMNASFEKMGVRVMDLMQVHNLLDWRTHLATLRDWKQAGRIRYLGVTHYSAGAYADLEKVMRSEKLDFVQLNYSIQEREAEERLLPLAQEKGIAVIANRPFGSGAVFGRVKGKPLPDFAREIGCAAWAQFLLKFVISHPAVTCAIPATAKPGHMAENLEAGRGPMPDEALRKRMAKAFAALT